MPNKHRRVFDTPFLSTVIALTVFGFIIFTSASLGLIPESSSQFGANTLSQLYGLLIGSALLVGALFMPYRVLRKIALPLLIVGFVALLLVYIPGLGFMHGGARRWILIGSVSFQPVELFKFAFVIYSAAWLAALKGNVSSITRSVVPIGILLAFAGMLLLSQPDTSSFIILSVTAFAMLTAAGVRKRHLAMLVGIALIGLLALVLTRPYILERVTVFFDPTHDTLGSGYQLQQSLIAIGSGGVFGRGFGRSIQKFDYLPEATGDSIFAVAAEEFGFIGSLILIVLLTFFAMRAYMISARAPDMFGVLLATGLATLIVSQSFLNIASMLGVFPLTGTPLLFVSKGGSALLFTLVEAGIIGNISRR